MRNLSICIKYNGSAYHGWQKQDNNITVQEVFDERLSRILGEKVTSHGCSRTDAGVHAREFYITVRTENPIPNDGLVKAMNSILPRDIAVLSCSDMPEEHHARFSAKGKEYIYLVDTSPIRDVFAQGLTLHYPYPLDAEKLDRISKNFIGRHDFGAFCKAEAKQHLATTVRTIFDYSVKRENERVTFTVSGDGFLHNMVRITVGTLIYINEGKRTEEDLLRSLTTAERNDAGVTIPPYGLYLNKVIY